MEELRILILKEREAAAQGRRPLPSRPIRYQGEAPARALNAAAVHHHVETEQLLIAVIFIIILVAGPR